MIRETIPSALAGERLDRVVALLTDASRSDAALLVAGGGASIDGAVVTSGKVRLAEGQTVEIDPAQRGGLPCFESGREILDGYTQRETRVHAATPADRPSDEPPILRAAAVHVARSDGQIRALFEAGE